MSEHVEPLEGMAVALHHDRRRHKVEEPELVAYDDRDIAALNAGIEAIKQLAARDAEIKRLRGVIRSECARLREADALCGATIQRPDDVAKIIDYSRQQLRRALEASDAADNE